MKRLIPALLAAPLMMVACQPASTGDEAPVGPVLSYEDAFIQAPLAGRDVTMGGIRISVEGGDVTLTGATTDAAASVETHTMTMEDGTMKMRPVEGWPIRDGETLVLERGGDHLMFFGVDETLSPGDRTNITLYFDTPGSEEPLTLVAEADVRSIGE